MQGADSWALALRGFQLLSACPHGLGGIVLRMRAGPDRDSLLNIARMALPDMVKISPSVDDMHLFGGLDLTATLTQAELVTRPGLLEKPRILCLTMAERCPADLAAKLAQYLDAHPTAVLLLLDEGASPEETVPDTLAERLAFSAEPEGHAPAQMILGGFDSALTEPQADAEHIEAIAQAAEAFGIQSLRAPIITLHAARGLAALKGREFVRDADLAEAAALVLAHRATRMPADDSPEQADPPPPDMQDAQDNAQDEDQMALPQDLVVDAVKALLPPELLAGLTKPKTRRSASGAGQGHRKKGNRRGRPLPSRPGRLDGRTRLDLLGTLRTAAPWQKMRRSQTPDRTGLLLRPSDFRTKRYESKSDRLMIFAVDASGSAAVARLNEAKGAIELLLGQAYAARDFVALVSFRDEGAECLLPPTRSLVQTKRKLSALPGGGGTPLAAGLNEALQLSVQARSRGMTPITILLTDGKANIALDGTPNRKRAREDAVTLAKQIRMQNLDTLVLDTSHLPHTALRDLAQHLDGRYMPLPRANAESLSKTVKTALDAA